MKTLLRLSSRKIKLFLIFTILVIIVTAQKETTKSEFLSFYRYIPEKMNWDEHKKLAAIMGGDLACITNATENEQVRRIAGGEIVWVGGIRKDCGNGPGADNWKWSNGKEWSYTNWREGEPNNYTKHDENRVMLWENGEWNDASLFHEFSAIYEIPSKFYFERKKTSTSKQSLRPQMSFVPPSGTWHGQWQTMFGAKDIDRGNDDLMLTFHDNGTITGGANDPRNGSFKVTGTWRSNGKVKFTYSNPGNGNDGETAHGQVKGNRMETDWTNRHCSGKAQYEYDQSSLKGINSSDVKNLNVSGAGSVEVNGTYVFMSGEHDNRHWGTIAGHYQHTQNPEIFIAFQDCGAGHNRPDWNKWMIISKIGVLYAAHSGGKNGVPTRDGGWETVDSWGNPGAPGGKHPAPTVRHGDQDSDAATRIQEHTRSKIPSDVGVTHCKPGPRLTYADSEAYAAKMEGRLLTLDEAKALMGGKALYPGEDQWCAVQGRDWVQVGDLHHHAGKSHNRECGGYPPWGDDANNTTYGNSTWNYVALYKAADGTSPKPTISLSSTGQKESIEILEAVSGKSVRFKLKNIPSSKDAWVGIFPPDARDQDHGDQNKRWKWLREIDVNNVSFPKQSEGDWSIRVFSDGGYTLHERKDFAVKPKLEIFSRDHNTNQYSQKEILDPTQTIQNRINNETLSYYKFIPEKMTWNEHNNRAIAMGGNLASISNAIEDNKVKEVSKGVNVWLGGVRKGCGNDTGADHWYWSNGKKWSFTNWLKNQPDNYHITHNKSEKSENRVHMTPISHGQQWNDISEDHQFSAVYELPIIDDSVDYFENNDIRLKNSNKIIRNPLRIILGSILTSRSGFQLNNIKSIGRE